MMKKKAMFVLLLLLVVPCTLVSAEETNPPVADTQPEPVEATVAAPAPVEPVAPAGEAAVSENLEFVSGEVLSSDQAAKTVTVKLYGETESQVSDKTITVTVDETTDVTDGEKSRELSSLTANTEVDVEYDPATNKATYIFVY